MLNIYKASAGSGKTYCLALNYIKLLLKDWSQDKDPKNYRHILAVTFTNKATGEMKSRILRELDCLANNEKSDFLDDLTKTLGEPENVLRNRAKIVIKDILNDYSHFMVSTIDRFFQQVIRAFVRDVGLQGGYQVELDADRVMQEAVDSLFTNLSEDKQLLLWLQIYAEENVNENKTWNLSSEIVKFAQNTFGDSANDTEIKLDTLEKVRQSLNKFIAITEEEFKNKATCALKIINDNGLLLSDFKGSTRSPFYVLPKLQSKDIESVQKLSKLKNNLDEWKSKSSTKIAQIDAAYNGGLNACIIDICDFADKNLSAYQTACLVRNDIRKLGLLSKIAKARKEILRERNSLLLSDANEFLKKIINDSDTPFVYEKIGTQIKHFMIDEFQDTSGTQWDNFRPLIENSLSQNAENMVVGDVKQSIYRFRNSDWSLLAGLKDNFNESQVHEIPLDSNYRSLKQIIQFNNAFFETAINLLCSLMEEEYNKDDFNSKYGGRMRRAYDNLAQKVPEKTDKKSSKGHVRMEFLKAKNNTEFQEKALEKIPDVIKKLQDNNYNPRDIAFLVRKSKDGQAIADFLMDYKSKNPNDKYCYDVISNDSLFLSSSNTVLLIISFLNYLLSSDDELTGSMLAYYHALVVNGETKSQAVVAQLSDEVKEFAEQVKRKPLFELTEEIIAQFKLGENKEQCVYLQSFQDVVYNYVHGNNNDVKGFVDWWNESGESKSKISVSENQNAMRIITIHKSKGLDFKAVVMPFCQWELKETSGRNTKVLWTSLSASPYNDLGKFPIKYGTKLNETAFENDYWEETMQQYIDNLNLIYVAFTRARNEMIVFTKASAENSKTSNNISVLLENTIHDQSLVSKLQCSSGTTDDDCEYFEIGSYEKITKEENTGEEKKMTAYLSRTFSDEEDSGVKMKLHSTDYFSETENKIESGNLMHSILQRIYTKSDTEKILTDMTLNGLIAQDELPSIRQKMEDFFSISGVAEWFEPKYKVLNETDIIMADKGICRPDRILLDGKNAIVIDYKFGEKELGKYTRQVSEYMRLIAKMGYSVKGYICYGSLKKVVAVE